MVGLDAKLSLLTSQIPEICVYGQICMSPESEVSGDFKASCCIYLGKQVVLNAVLKISVNCYKGSGIRCSFLSAESIRVCSCELWSDEDHPMVAWREWIL